MAPTAHWSSWTHNIHWADPGKILMRKLNIKYIIKQDLGKRIMPRILLWWDNLILWPSYFLIKIFPQSYSPLQLFLVFYRILCQYRFLLFSLFMLYDFFVLQTFFYNLSSFLKHRLVLFPVYLWLSFQRDEIVLYDMSAQP